MSSQHGGCIYAADAGAGDTPKSADLTMLPPQNQDGAEVGLMSGSLLKKHP